MRGFPAWHRDQRGQSTSEYILIIVLVVIAVVIAVHLFGSRVKDKFFSAGDTVKLSGPESHGSQSGSSGSSSSSSPARTSGSSSAEGDASYRYFGDEDALEEFEEERKKAWFKTILVFAVAGAILLILIFMTVERIRMIKKQMRMQQDSDDIRRGPRRRKAVSFKKGSGDDN